MRTYKTKIITGIGIFDDTIKSKNYDIAYAETLKKAHQITKYGEIFLQGVTVTAVKTK
jgi:hypothetical protein